MKSKIVVQGSLSELFYNPRHIHSLNRRIAASTIRPISTRVTPTLRSILNKNSKMGRTNDPVLLQSPASVAENHLNNIQSHLNQKWASSLAAQQKINVDTPKKNSSTASTISSGTQLPSILLDKSALMGIISPLLFLIVLFV
jgi:hypothetical protein